MRTKQKKVITHIVKEVKLYLQIIQPSIYRILLGPLKITLWSISSVFRQINIKSLFFLCIGKDQSKNGNKTHFIYNSIKQYKILRN